MYPSQDIAEVSSFVENILEVKLFILLKWAEPFGYFRVWDKVISGSCKILVFVALEILLSYKIVLMGISRPEGVVKFLCSVSKQQNNTLIAHKTIMHCFCPHSRCFCTTSQQLVPFQIPQENTDAIVTKAIDLWHKYCGTPIHAV